MSFDFEIPGRYVIEDTDELLTFKLNTQEGARIIDSYHRVLTLGYGPRDSSLHLSARNHGWYSVTGVQIDPAFPVIVVSFEQKIADIIFSTNHNLVEFEKDYSKDYATMVKFKDRYFAYIGDELKWNSVNQNEADVFVSALEIAGNSVNRVSIENCDQIKPIGSDSECFESFNELLTYARENEMLSVLLKDRVDSLT